MGHLEREAVRYLGYGKHAVDDGTLALIAESFADLRKVAEQKSIYRIFALSHGETGGAGRLAIGGLEIESRNLAKNLKGCGEAALFAATLGVGVDRLIRRVEITNMAKAVVLQACAAAYLEEYCDACQERIAREARREGKYLRPRFSPGYGDFSLSYQAGIMRMLDCAKQIGLTMTDGCLMTPVKSVTAVIGICMTDVACHQSGCGSCRKRDCPYRRD
jgi:hypothetical protein